MDGAAWHLLWNDELVGWLASPRLDGVVGRGQFVPGEARLADPFVAAVNAEVEPVVVRIDGLSCQVVSPFDEGGEFVFIHLDR